MITAGTGGSYPGCITSCCLSTGTGPASVFNYTGRRFTVSITDRVHGAGDYTGDDQSSCRCPGSVTSGLWAEDFLLYAFNLYCCIINRSALLLLVETKSHVGYNNHILPVICHLAALSSGVIKSTFLDWHSWHYMIHKMDLFLFPSRRS